MTEMKKVIVIGCAGSGKSYFSRRLSEKTVLPLYHLDMIWWREDGTNIERDEFDARLSEILAQDAWIIDGNYTRTMERRMAECDTVFFFDLSTEDCLMGVGERMGKTRHDMPWKGAGELNDHEFVEYIKNYDTAHRPRVIELLEKYKDKRIVTFNDRAGTDEFLKEI